MAYTKTTWVDRLVETPNLYTKTDESSSEVTLTPAPGTVTAEGTPISSSNMNKIEQGIADVDAALVAHGADYTLQVPYAVATGTANTYAISTPIASLAAGMAVSVKINIASSGASTLNWDGKGAKSIKKADGTNMTLLKANGVYTFRYDGTNFIIQGEGGEYGTAGAAEVLDGYTVGTAEGLVNGAIPLITADTAGTAIGASTGRVYIKPPLNRYWDNAGYFTYYDDPDFIPANIKKDVEMLGLVGTYEVMSAIFPSSVPTGYRLYSISPAQDTYWSKRTLGVYDPIYAYNKLGVLVQTIPTTFLSTGPRGIRGAGAYGITSTGTSLDFNHYTLAGTLIRNVPGSVGTTSDHTIHFNGTHYCGIFNNGVTPANHRAFNIIATNGTIVARSAIGDINTTHTIMNGKNTTIVFVAFSTSVLVVTTGATAITTKAKAENADSAMFDNYQEW